MGLFDAARSKQMGILKENPLDVQAIELEEAADHKPTSVYYPQSFRKHVDSDSEEPEMDSEEEPEEDPEEEPEEDPEEPEEDPEEEPEEDPEKEPEEDPEEEPEADLEMDGKLCIEKVVAVECATPFKLSNEIVSAEQPTEVEVVDPSAECVFEPDPKSDANKVYQNLSNGKQRIVVSAAVRPSLPQNFCLEKNCKYDEASKQEFKVKYAAIDQHCVPGELEGAVVRNKNSVKEANPGKRRCSKWDQDSGGYNQEVIEDRTCKKGKTMWDANNFKSTRQEPLQLTDLRSSLCGPLLNLEVQSLKKRFAEISSILDPLVDDKFEIGVYAPDKLLKEREKIFLELAKRNAIISKELYVPVKEYPTYNFIGLILGPKGNTQKRMELKSGARIRLRGIDSSKSAQEADPSANEELNVCIEAITQTSLDTAVCMVKKLLIPIEDEMNDHKRAQLQELYNLKAASLLSSCSMCKEPGHNQLACPRKKTTLRIPCDSCGSFGHPTFGCPATPLNLKTKSSKEINDANLYIGYLPQTVDDSRLRELFSPFGTITQSRVTVDMRTGYSMGYGFVKFDTSSAASLAIMHMNGYQIDGHRLRVRIAGAPPAKAQPATSLFPVFSNPEPAAVATSYPAFPQCIMPKAEVPVLNDEGIGVPSSLNTESSYQFSQTKAPVIPQEDLGSNLFVGFLPQTIDDSHLRELFSPFGTIIQLRVPLDMRSGYNKGFGFVRFDTPSAASLAIMHMNGYEIDGHRLTVRIARAPTATEQPATSIVPVYPYCGPATVATSCAALPDGVFPEAQVSVLSGEGFSYPSSQHMVNSTNLYVGFLPITVDDSYLRELFSPFGTVTCSRVILDMRTGYSKGYGFVSFDTPFAASLATMHMNGYQIDGHKLAVRMRTATARPPATSLLPVYSIPQPTAVTTSCPALPDNLMTKFSQNMESKNQYEAPISPQEVLGSTCLSTSLSSTASVVSSTSSATASSSTSLISGSSGSRTALSLTGLVATSTDEECNFII